MTCYSVQPKDQIFVRGCRFLYFAKHICKNIGKIISKNLSSKYSQKFFDHAKQLATNAFRTFSKSTIQKTAEAIGNLIGDKIAEVSKNSPQNISETVESKAEIPRERCISPEARQQFIHELRSI